MIQNLQEILKKYYGYSDFRFGQREIIESILSGRDTVGIMPTGAGKSMCYQIPALIMSGVALVISPLISLMKDQVDALNELGIPSTFINSSLGWSEIEQNLRFASQGKFKLIYVAPERLESEAFLNVMKNIEVSILAIDEAHCVSQWGHDFRPSYRFIVNLLPHLGTRPIIAAFTATATEQVKQDIVSLLKLAQPNVYVTGFDRKNLFFSIEKGVNKLDYVIDFLYQHREQSGIIYAATRKEVDRVYEALYGTGFQVGKYHAGLSDSERSKVQEEFSYDSIRIMVATNAFGMGIDKSNVRFVIHFNMPKNLESYYQEAGRAGRDGDEAECILLYGPSDVQIQKFLIEQGILSNERKAAEYNKLQDMVDYCHTDRCLRKYILEYFGEEGVGQTCGNCGNCNDDRELGDITVEVQKILSCVKRMGEQFGANLVANVLRGSNNKKIRQLKFDMLPTYGIMKEYPLTELTDLINLLIAEEYLFVTEGVYPVVKLGKKAIPVLRGIDKVFRKIRKRVEAAEAQDMSLFDILRKLRKELSEEHNVPPYVIFHDSTLKEMSRSYPVDRQSMLAISGVGESKFEKYGNRFIEAIVEYMTQHGIESSFGRTAQPKPSKNNSAEPSYKITYKMHLEGKSLKEIAEARELTLTTVEDHIIQYGKEDGAVEWSKFINFEQERLILKAIEEVGANRLRPIKDILPDDISYFMIKAVICKNIV